MVFILGISRVSCGRTCADRFRGSPRHAPPGGPKEGAFYKKQRAKGKRWQRLIVDAVARLAITGR
ncbi:MAG TPA: hypothetical protein VHZ78_10930, partial [Rhizomicrobium sp.]|nr:hypothetical protein [Rhizomicrobium sp.]